jgi:hypothetical protein
VELADGVRRLCPSGDVEEDVGRRNEGGVKCPGLVDEHANSLVTGSWKSKPLGLDADSPVDLSDRTAVDRVPFDDVEESR